MEIYLNPNNEDFKMALDSEIYVDKSLLIEKTNEVIRTEQRFVSVSRPRRFGKSIAANMLTAYYSRGCDSREIQKLCCSGVHDRYFTNQKVRRAFRYKYVHRKRVFLL